LLAYPVNSNQPSGKPRTSRKKQAQQEALNAFLVAADALVRAGQLIEAELRFKDALRTAEREFGLQSDQAMLVSSILAAFYRFHNREWEAKALEARLEAWQMQATSEPEDEESELGKKFAGKKAKEPQAGEHPTKKPGRVSVPAAHRKACQILGLPPEEGISVAEVNRAWKKQMLNTSAHPDLGGNTDEAVLLNRAKEELMNYLESLQPKLKLKGKSQ